MLSATQRNLIDKAAQIRGVDEHAFCRDADERRRDPVELAREVLGDAEDGSTQQRAKKPTPEEFDEWWSKRQRLPAAASTAPKRKESNLASLFEGWAEDYNRCCDNDDADGLFAVAKSAKEHIRDPALYVLALSLSTIHRIKREKLEARLAALEASDSRKSEERIAYQGVYEAGNVYEPGDVCTHGGTLWHCWERTTDRPGTKSWQLMVKTR